MQQNTTRAEAERLLGIASKLLQTKDLHGSREFAVLAQETEPLLDGSDQILAVVDVLIAGEKRINHRHMDWYGILQMDSARSDDAEAVKRQYRRLALLLHPDKNKFAFSDVAFKLVADAWAVLSDPGRKSAYDGELFAFTRVDLVRKNQGPQILNFAQQNKLPVRRGGGEAANNSSNNNANAAAQSNVQQPNAAAAAPSPPASIWTVCPYCYNLYEYPKAYEGCCLRCQNCERAFQAVVISTLPPTVPGKDAYYCCWGFFPMGFSSGNAGKGAGGFPGWVPPMFPGIGNAWNAPGVMNGGGERTEGVNGGAVGRENAGFVNVPVAPVQRMEPTSNVRVQPMSNAGSGIGASGIGAGQKKKRGRPRKNPL